MKVSKTTAGLTASLMIGVAMFSFTSCTNENGNDEKLTEWFNIMLKDPKFKNG